MANVFGRKYKLSWGSPKRIKIAPTSITVAGETFQRGSLFPGMISDKDILIPSNALSVDDLHIKTLLPIKKTKKASSSDAFIIEVYNMDEDLTKTMFPDDIVVLEAGYETDEVLPAVFIGSFRRTVTTQKGQDRITKLICVNDTGAVRGFFSKWDWAPGTTYDTMIKEVMADLAEQGLPSGRPLIGSGSGLPIAKDIKTETGITAKGNGVKTLDSLCQEIDYRAYVTLNTLWVEPNSIPLIRQVITIEQDNIIGRIEKSVDNIEKLSGQKGEGIKFTLFLDGRITPSTKIEIAFGDFKGTYFVKAITHNMEFEGKRWETEVLCDAAEVQ